ncbi:hypothetical protein [Jiangella asiatica]|uniref:hypothetical protein n=1 Tax=Jiangella asiatica TaxID=2530372 RepID=UPI0013A5D6D5|nr:hypothetical protein [Jiangella asiatica]
MSVWLLVRRALTTHRGAAVLLAVVVGVGAFLGAAAPRWVGERLDDTLRGTVTAAGPAAQLSARDARQVQPADFDRELSLLDSGASADLRSLLGEGRWSTSTGARGFVTQNGAQVDDGQRPRMVNVRAPDDLAGRVRVVDGELPATVTSAPGPGGDASLVDAVVTAEVAEALRLEVGDTLAFERAGAADDLAPVEPGAVPGLRVTGVIEPLDPDDPLWADARTALVPDLGVPGSEPRITTGTVLTDPTLVATWAAATADRFDTEWHVPLEADALTSAILDRVTAELRQLAGGGMWSSGLITTLEAYPAQRAAAEGVVGFGIVSFAALCGALVLLSSRLLAERRADEVALARTRGAADGRLARLLALDAAVVAVPPAVVGAAAATVAVDGPGGWAGPALAAGLVLVAVAAVPVMALRARSNAAGIDARPDVAAVRPSPRRLVLEAAAVALAGLGLWLAGTRQPGAGIDPVVSLAPILVAGATGLVIFRALPHLVRAVLPPLRRARTLTPFLALARTARTPGHAVLPVIALLVAIGVAAFGGTVQASVERAREVSSWESVGADALIRSDVIRVDSGVVESLPGADAVAAGYLFTNQRPVNLDNGRSAGVDVLAVDIDAWQAVTSGAPELPAALAALTGPTASGAPAALITGNIDVVDVGDQLEVTIGDATTTVEVAESTGDVPGTDQGIALVVPLDQVAAALPPWPDVIYVAGDVDDDQVAAALGVDPSEVTLRTDVLATSSSDVVLDTVLDVFQVVTAASAVLAAAAAVLALAVGDRGRQHGLSILRTLGLTARQSAVLTASDVVPICVLAAVAGIGVGTATGLVTAGAVDLPALSGVLVGGTATVPDLPSAVVAAAAVLAAVLVAVAVSVVVGRRARLGSVLRAGEPT